jgi:hypothetical protein
VKRTNWHVMWLDNANPCYMEGIQNYDKRPVFGHQSHGRQKEIEGYGATRYEGAMIDTQRCRRQNQIEKNMVDPQ